MAILGRKKKEDGNVSLEKSAIARFQALSIREYYEKSLTTVLLEGLKEVGMKRPENPIEFLGKYLLDHSKTGKKEGKGGKSKKDEDGED